MRLMMHLLKYDQSEDNSWKENCSGILSGNNGLASFGNPPTKNPVSYIRQYTPAS